VLLHGLASTRRWWDLVTAELPWRRVVRWDHRGHGQSAAPPGRYRLEVLAADAATILDLAGVRRCVVAGHSMGAAVALQLAARRPDLVAGICCVEGGLADPKILFGRDWPAARTAMQIDRRTEPTRAVLAAWTRGTGLPDTALAAVLANYRPAGSHPDRLRLRLDRRHEETLAHSLWCQTPAELLNAVGVPVTVVTARPADSQQAELYRAALHSTLTRAGRSVTQVWISGGHELPLQHPQQIAAAIAGLADQVAES